MKSQNPGRTEFLQIHVSWDVFELYFLSKENPHTGHTCIQNSFFPLKYNLILIETWQELLGLVTEEALQNAFENELWKYCVTDFVLDKSQKNPELNKWL